MDSKKVEAMRAGGKIMAKIFAELREYTQAGMTGKEIDAWVAKKITDYGCGIAYYEPDVDFPGSICISVNDELIHSIPKDIPLEEGDKVSYDLVIKYHGYYVDSAFTMIVGNKPTAAQRHLLSFTESALYEGIEQVRPGAKLGDIGYAVQKQLEKGKLGVITNYVGHGIGTSMHMPPEVPNYGKRGHGYTLKVGDTICIEPMSSLGKPDNIVVEDEDGWTVCLKDGSLGCHFEHTILVTEDGYEILTQL